MTTLTDQSVGWSVQSAPCSQTVPTRFPAQWALEWAVLVQEPAFNCCPWGSAQDPTGAEEVLARLVLEASVLDTPFGWAVDGGDDEQTETLLGMMDLQRRVIAERPDD